MYLPAINEKIEEIINKDLLYLKKKSFFLEDDNILISTIVSKILSRKYRISKIDINIIENIKNEVNLAVKCNYPIRLVSPFGCYKPSSLPSPNVPNWSEFFHLIHISKLATDISVIYKYGVEIVYKLGDIDMHKISNVSMNNVNNYFVNFTKLIGLFDNFSRKNIKYEVHKLSECISYSDYKYICEEQVDYVEKLFIDNSDYLLNTSKRVSRNNYGKILSNKEIYNISLKSETMVIADLKIMSDIKSINLIYRKITKIMTIGDITVYPFRSYGNTITQFWVGEGVFIFNGKKVYPTILGSNSILKYEEKLSVPVDLLINPCGENFETITVYAGI